MSNKSVHSDSAEKYKKIKNDLMNFEKKEIIKTKNSHKDIKITTFDDSDKKVINSKYYSLKTKKLEQINFEDATPNIEIIEQNENKINNEEDEVGSSDISEENDD